MAGGNSDEQERTERRRRGVRFGSLAVIALGGAAAAGWIWGFHGAQRQDRIIASLVLAALVALLLLLWLLALSGLRRRVRLAVVVGLLVLTAAAVATVERGGVTGDVLPLLRWRWARPEPPAPESGPAGPVAAGTAVPASDAGDWSQLLGPRGDGVSPGPPLDADWSARPPVELWRRTVGAGWSGFAVHGSYAVTHEQRGEFEVVAAYDRMTGEPLWIAETAERHEDPLGGAGPRATPAIEAGRVFALGGTGLLSAHDLATGRLLWRVDVIRSNGAGVPLYGVSASPRVMDGRVVAVAGGPAGRSLVAYGAEGGEPLWGAGDREAAYSSPVAVELGGVAQWVVLDATHLSAYARGNGRVLWQFPWPAGTQNVAQPVALDGDRLFASSGYGVGGKMLRIEVDDSRLEPRLLWESNGLKAKFSDIVELNGFLYGLDDGILVCLDAESGKRRWKGGRYGHGQLILVGELLVIQAEDGRVVLVRADSEGHAELGSIRALSSKTWNHPALAGAHLLVRNDREAACYRLPLE